MSARKCGRERIGHITTADPGALRNSLIGLQRQGGHRESQAAVGIDLRPITAIDTQCRRSARPDDETGFADQHPSAVIATEDLKIDRDPLDSACLAGHGSTLRNYTDPV